MASNQNFTLNIKALFDASDVRAKVASIQQSFSKLKLPESLRTSLTSAFQNVEKSLSNFESRVEKGISSKADAKGMGTAIDTVVKDLQKLESLSDKVKSELSGSTDLSKIIQLDEGTVSRLKQAADQIKDLQKQIDQLNASKLQSLNASLEKITGKKSKEGAAEAIKLFEAGDIEAAEKKLDGLISKLTNLGGKDLTTNRFKPMIDALKEMKDTMSDTDVGKLTGQQSEIAASAAKIAADGYKQISDEAQKAADSSHSVASGAKEAAPPIKDAADNSARLSTELESVKSRIQYFVGLTNAVNLFKRAVSSAFNTVKELDAAMTETAVVTDKTISDMWKQLPEYTSRANSLGVTTLDAYKAATLYYQQGLNDQQAAELSNETLKMARIAGLDAAEATDRMTNALRGFNMELNAMNAQRIDDVYSQLAAMSASNVDEISTAMTKVASLANNANMDFETTSAFLAQIIETTRESAETAGTALKTVVARFSEVKKLYSEGELKGTNEEGEAIDVNRISTALRTAGIDLNKYFLGEVGLDDIFMELASKWDSLTSVQQRYIATQAAGSRQQSRFIAMMQDYARTQELVGAAYSANGAAAEQFEKTQSSLQSKLARLKNAWDEFAMGLANNALVKLAVDALTLLLNTVNKLTGAFGPAVGSILKFTTAAMALIGLRNAFKSGGVVMKGLDKLSNTKVGQFILGTKGQDEAGASAKLAQGGESAKTSMKVGGETAAKALVKGATEAANIEKGSAVEEAATEQAGATGEVATEQAGAMQKVATEQAGADLKAAIEQGSATTAAEIEINGAIQETAIEKSNITDFGDLGDIFKKRGGGFNPKNLFNQRKFKPLVAQYGGNLSDDFGDLVGSLVKSPAGQQIDDFADQLSKLGSNAADGISDFSQAAITGGEAIANSADDVADALGKIGAVAPAAGAAAGNAAGTAAGAAAGNAAGVAAGAAGLSGLAIAGIVAAVIAVVVGSVALQDAFAFGKFDTLRANRRTKEEKAELEEITNERIKLQEAYKAYTDAQEAMKNASTKTEYVNAQANARAAAYQIRALDSSSTTISSNGKISVLGSQVEKRLEEIGSDESTQKAIVGFSESQQKIAEANSLLKQQLTLVEHSIIGTDGQSAGSYQAAASASIWDNIKNYFKYGEINTQEQVDAYNADLQAQADKLRGEVAAQTAASASEILKISGVDSKLIDSISSAYGNMLSQLSPKDYETRTQDDQAAKDLTSLASIASNENGQKLLELIGGTYEGVLSDTDLGELETTYSNLSKELKASLDSLLGITTENPIEDVLKNYNTTLKNQQRAFRGQTVAALENIGIFDSGILDAVVNKLTLTENSEVSSYIDKFSEFGDEFSSKIATSMIQAMDNGQWYGSELKDFIDSISENPILAYQSIKDTYSKNTQSEGPLKDLSQALMNDVLNNPLFSREGQVQWYLASGEFANIEEELQKIIEANGQLTSHNIDELAKSSKTLSTLLDNNTISANGLAFAMTALEKGNITVLDLNANVLKLYNSFDTVGSAIQRAGQFIKDFDPGENWGDALAFMTDAASKIEGFVEKGEFGNPQYQNYWKAIYGTDAPINATEAYAGIDMIRRMTDNHGAGFWEEAVGFQRDEQGLLGMQLYGEGGFEKSDAKSYRDYIKGLVEQRKEKGEFEYTLTDDLYDMMMRNLADHDPTIVKEIASTELDKIMEAYGSTVPSKSDIQAIADAWGLDPEEILESYNESHETNYKFDGLKDYVSKSTTSLADAVRKVDSSILNQDEDNYSEMVTALGLGTDGQFSIDALKVKIGQVVPEVKDGSVSVDQYLNEQVFNGEPLTVPVKVSKFIEDENGAGTWTTEEIPVTIKADSVEEARQQLEAATEQLRSQTLFSNSEEWATNLVATLQGLNDIPGVDKISASIKTAQDEANTLRGLLSDIPANVTLHANPATLTATGAEGSVTVTLAAAAASGGIVSAANGTLQPGMALTGEEDPEIVWNKEKGYAYLAGANGPEINNLKPGDRVFNAQDTKSILKRSGIKSFAKGTIGSYANTDDISIVTPRIAQEFQKNLTALNATLISAIDQMPDETKTRRRKRGTGSSGLGGGNNNNSGGNGGGDNSKPTKKKPEWENTLDWLYNLMEDITELERVQTRLSETHDRYLEDISKTGRDLYNVTKQQLDNLITQRDNYQEALNRRLQEMREQITEGDEELRKYVWWNAEDQTIEIDWDAINEIDSEDTFKEVTDLVSKAEKIQDQIDEAEEAIWNIEGEIKEIEGRYLQEFIDFQKRVYDAVVYQYQQQIDELTSLNDTLNDSNEKILSSIQREIELQRQIRDNTDKENEISEKEARLAYLRRDTTGANAEEIRSLEKEIEEARKSYTDELIDQAMDRLEQQNSDASEQRQHQIDLMTSQLDYWKEVGAFWPEVAKLLNEGINGEGSLIRGSTLEEILKGAEGWKAMSEQEREVWANDLINEAHTAGAYILKMSEGLDSLSKGIWALIPESSIPEWAREDGTFATGGLTTKTGPAWVDGTPASPEYILNARQTEAFLELTDTLPSLLSGANGTTNNYGGNVYVEVNLNVGEINNDYDVDSLVDRIKTDIYDAAAYRNVNTIGRSR